MCFQGTPASRTPNLPGQLPVFKNLMSEIRAQSQRESRLAGDFEFDAVKKSATVAIEHYLSLPMDDEDGNSFTFWRNHSKTTDKAQRALCHLARIYLTPPPTSTGKSIIFH